MIKFILNGHVIMNGYHSTVIWYDKNSNLTNQCSCRHQLYFATNNSLVIIIEYTYYQSIICTMNFVYCNSKLCNAHSQIYMILVHRF